MGPRVLTAVLYAAALATLLGAADAQVTMKAEAGFKGYYKQTRWAPVTAIIENSGGAIEGELIVVKQPLTGPQETYRRQVSLPSTSRKRISLYVPIADTRTRLEVELRSGWRSIAKQTVTLKPAYDEDEVIVIFAEEKGALQYLNGKQSPKPVAQTNTSYQQQGGPGSPTARSSGNTGQVCIAYADKMTMPDRWIGFDGVDLLVIGRISVKELSAEQQDAIRQWVTAGGTLVITGGADWTRLTDPFYEALLPIVPTGAIGVPVAGPLAFYSTRPFQTDPTAQVTTGTLRADAESLIGLGGSPLIAQRAVGSGTCIFLAFDYAEEPVRGWDGAYDFWRDLMPRQTASTPLEAAYAREQDYIANSGYRNYGNQGQSNVAGPIHAVSQTPELKPPSFGLVALFLTAYVLVLVPGTYLFLKAKRRLELAWIVMPIIVVTFSIGAYVIGYSMKGGDLILNRVALVESAPGQRQALADDFSLIFSPRRTQYEVEFAAPTSFGSEVNGDADSPSSNRPRTIDQTGNMTVRDLPMDMWASRVFHTRGIVDLGKGIDGAITIDSAGIPHGTVTNGSKSTVFDVSVVMPRDAATAGQAFYLGDIPAGGRLDIDKSGKATAGGAGAIQIKSAGGQSQALNNMVVGLRDAVFSLGGPPRDIVVVGWQSKSMLPVLVRGREPEERAATFYVVHFPTVSGGAAQSTYNYESASVTVGAMNNASQQNFPGSTSLVSLNPGGFSEFNLAMPYVNRGVTLQGGEITVDTRCSNNERVDLAVYDTVSQTWVTIAGDYPVATGDTQWQAPLKGVAAQRIIDRNSNVRVRVKLRSVTGGAMEVRNVDLTLYGTMR